MTTEDEGDGRTVHHRGGPGEDIGHRVPVGPTVMAGESGIERGRKVHGLSLSSSVLDGCGGRGDREASVRQICRTVRPGCAGGRLPVEGAGQVRSAAPC